LTAQYILSIDQGTTGSTAIVVDASDKKNLQVIGRKTIDFPQHYPHPGWVEHDLNEIWDSVRRAITSAIEIAQKTKPSFSKSAIGAIGITNQRETLCVFERKSGKPLARAIVWQCQRSAEICVDLQKKGYEGLFNRKTGLVVNPYFSGTKITWLMQNNPTVAAEVKAGRALFGTIDTFLLYKLTSGSVYATEPSNASRTLCFDIERREFDSELLQIIQLPSRDALPEVRDSAGVFGKTKGVDFLPDGIAIAGVLGDQQAALAGQTCFEVGEAKCTYGTGAFLLLNTGSERLHSTSQLLTTIAWSLDGKLTYAFEGAAFIAGAAVQFIRDQMHLLNRSEDSEALARDCVGAPEVYFVPALAGLGAPHWNFAARGAFFGLTRGTSNGQMIRATLEGINFQVCDLLDAMKRDFPGALKVLRVDGGAVANDLLMQTQANFSDIPVDRPQNIETTAFGAALFAGLGVGMYQDLNELKGVRKSAKIFQPDATFAKQRQVALQGWQRAVSAVRVFAGTP
jgi:glycerol kinase